MIKPNPKHDELLTQFGKETMKRSYCQAHESFQDVFARVARHNQDNDEHGQFLYDIISQQFLMPSSPILSNSGTGAGMPISCFVNSTPDSMDGIRDTWMENVDLARNGGGVGTYWGNVRSIGEGIRGRGKSSGIIPFLKVQDSMTLGVNQGDQRRGSAATYLNAHHPEIGEFLDMRRPSGGDPDRKCLNLHHGVVFTDEFMRAKDQKGAEYELKSPRDGSVRTKVDARSVWIRTLENRMFTGEPYMLFIDNVNRANPPLYKALGLRVETSNLCVAPETKILTSDGYQIIGKLAGKKVKVWNGEEWSKVTVRKTASMVKLRTVKFSDGSDLTCTPDHKFYVQTSDGIFERPAKKLKAGDKMIKFDMPTDVQHGNKKFDRAYMHGFFCGDGTYNNQHGKQAVLHLYDEKMKLVEALSRDGTMKGSGEVQSSSNRMSFILPHDLKPKFEVPQARHSLKSKLRWLAGLFDADGCVARNGSAYSIQLASINKEFLDEVRLLLNTMGIQPKVAVMLAAGREVAMPNGKGGVAQYDMKEAHRIMVSPFDTQKLLDMGLKTHRLDFSGMKRPNRDARRFVEVMDVLDEGRVDDTYCFTEPKRHMGVFNGVLTGQCNEIMLHTGIDYLGKIRTAVCCLASLNFATYDQWKHMLDEVVEAALRMLDNVLTDFINRAKGIPGFANSAYAAERERSVGLGFMGLHTYLQSKGIAYESEEGLEISTEISRRVAEASDRVNAKLAQEKGACLDSQYAYEKFGTPLVRFAHTSAIAPTATISIIAGTVSPGAELIVANAYVQKTLSGTFINRNPNLERLLSSYGQNTEAVWSSITINSGSVQHLDFLSDHEKAVFRTAREVDQVWVIKYAGARQPYISQGQSVNVFVNADIHKKKLHEIHQLAWEMGLKGLYYLRAKAARKASLEATATNYGTWGGLTEAQAIAIVDQQDKDDAAEEQKRLERMVAASGGEPSFDECLACQ